MTGRQLQALPAREHAAYWNQAGRQQARRVVRQIIQAPDRDIQTEFLELLRTLARPVVTN